jgi:arabinan endo-1,5-alpha-L-arabinosidase
MEHRGLGRHSLSTARIVRFFLALTLGLLLVVAPAGARTALPQTIGTYSNPLPIQIPAGGTVQSCADPSIIYSHTVGDTAWYVHCTTDPLNGTDKDSSGNFHFHLMPILKSYDLVHWIYQGDVFSAKPAWVNSTAGLWAPDIHYFNGSYYLYYTASATNLPGGGSAIGVATSLSPTGPWTDSGTPVVGPEPQGFWDYDPAVVSNNGQLYIFYGSYYGGVRARTLSPDGLTSNPASQQQITIPNRYEGTYLVHHGSYWYLFGSATNCCNGPLTGYSVFVGRSANVLGPYLDRNGNSLLAGRVGGTPVISMNGNRWVGTGHNAVFTDFAGQDWFLYHAVDRTDPFFAGATGFTRRPLMMDPLDWIDGWPTVRGGLWASDSSQPAPAAQPGTTTNYRLKTPRPDLPSSPYPTLSDEFNGDTLSSQWSWVRPPSSAGYSENGGTFNFDTQAADLYLDSNNASVLTEPAPSDNYVVDTRVRLNVPAEGCCFNYVQAGLVIYGNDDNYIKLATVSIWETRQTEFAKELSPVPAGFPRYGNTVVGPPGEWTYLRIVKETAGGQELYRAYTSQNGVDWVRGGVWTHSLGSSARIGLVSMGGSGFTANFDYVHVYGLRH